MPLIIVESPTKSKNIERFLGKKYQTAASFGHIRDLPKSKLGIDIENDFSPQYVIPAKSRKVVSGLKKLCQKSKDIILASVDYNEPILIKCPDGLTRQFKVGNFIDRALSKKIDYSLYKVLSFNNKTHKVSFKPIKAVSSHPINEYLLEITLDYGRKLKITASHSVFTKNKNGKIKLRLGKNIKVGDNLLVPVRLPPASQKLRQFDLLKLIYKNENLRKKVFISSPRVLSYRREKVLAPKAGKIPQFQPRLILSHKLRSILKRKRKKLGWSQKFLANKINCSQPHICELEKRENPTLTLGKRYLESLDFTLKKATKNLGVKIAPSSIEIAIKNALDNQWRDSRKSLTHTWQPLTRFNWKEIKRNFKEDKEIKISRHNHLHLMPRFIPVNKSLMLFLGFFIAEGSYLQNAIKFSFGKKTLGGEKENIERVKKISKQLFNLSPSDFEDRTSNSLVLNSSLVTFLLKDVLGIKGNVETKEVPWIVFNVPPALQSTFLEGLFLGDGSLHKENITFNTISPKLAQGIRFLLLQDGILTSHSIGISKKPNRKPVHNIIISGRKRLSETRQIWEKHYKAEITRSYLRKRNWYKKNFSLIKNQKGALGLLKIKSIKKVKPSVKFVYDFSVEGENFICGDGGVCAHNTDQDREGEAIAYHLKEILNLDNYQRIVFHEITKKAILEALKNPRKIDMNLVNSQVARRVLDRIVGYKLSPLLWKKVARGLSAGRVQSVAVRLIVEREREIEAFKPEEYWTIVALLQKQSQNLKSSPAQGGQETQNHNVKPKTEFESLLIEKDGKKIPKLGIEDKEKAEEIVKDLNGAEFQVRNIQRKEVKRNPLPPFTTSTLQQTAGYQLHFSSQRTMSLAQGLYENGLITYHRTDSLNLSQEALSAAKKFIINNIGQDYWPGFSRKFKTKSKGAQEAHEAIRPTDIEKIPKKTKLEGQYLRLYELIWKRFVASQMKQAIFDSINIKIAAKNYIFQANGQTQKFDGFLKVYPMKFKEAILPHLTEKEILELLKLTPFQHFTQPPARYNEPSLIKTLEQLGIGRPSTYAPTIFTIQKRNYVQKNEQRKFQPTEIGIVVNDLLVEHFPKIVDVKFTADMENDLDKIAQGKQIWQNVVKDFYEPFAKNLDQKYEKLSKKEIAEEKTNKVCPKCGSPLIIKLGRFGKFYACTGFPKCKYTESLKDNKLGIKCPKCGSPSQISQGETWEGKGEIVEKRTRKGKLFYGCNRYPKCDFAVWDKPLKEPCPKCGWPLVKTNRGQTKCSNPDCQNV